MYYNAPGQFNRSPFFGTICELDPLHICPLGCAIKQAEMKITGSDISPGIINKSDFLNFLLDSRKKKLNHCKEMDPKRPLLVLSHITLF